MQTAPNGNSTGANDPNFIHFDEEQAGTLLPNAPGYPFFLPSLQISPKGRLCFWNFPNKIFKAVVSNPANIGTTNYLRDGKGILPTLTQILSGETINQFPPIPGDLGTNGSGNQYFWGACNSYFIMTQALADELNNQLVSRLYYGNLAINPATTVAEIENDVFNNPGYVLPEVGKYNTENGSKPFYPWDWIEYSIQYYLNKFLVTPYDVGSAVNPQYGASWTGTLSKASETNQLQMWLSGTNFFVNLVAHPDFLQSLSNALPVLILTAATLVSGGLATPILGAIVAADKSAAVQQSALTNAENAAQAGGATNMTEAIQSIAPATYIYFGIAILILILIIAFYKHK